MEWLALSMHEKVSKDVNVAGKQWQTQEEAGQQFTILNSDAPQHDIHVVRGPPRDNSV